MYTAILIKPLSLISSNDLASPKAESAEPARAPRASERGAAHKVEKGLAAPGALQREDLVNDVVPSHEHGAALLVEGRHLLHLEREPCSHGGLRLLVDALLRGVRVRVQWERGGSAHAW